MNSQDTRYFVHSYTSLQRNLFLMLFYLDVSIRVVFKFVERLFQVFNVYVFFFLYVNFRILLKNFVLIKLKKKKKTTSSFC